MDPCGTPVDIKAGIDSDPLRLTICFLSMIHDVYQCSI